MNNEWLKTPTVKVISGTIPTAGQNKLNFKDMKTIIIHHVNE
jgi:hypothetical protein